MDGIPETARATWWRPLLDEEVIALLGCASVAALVGLAVGGIEVALATALAIATLLPYVIARAQGRAIDFGEPIYAISAVYLLIFALRTYYILAEPVQMIYFSARPYRDALTPALLLALGGYLIFVVGYYSPLGVRLGSRIPAPTRRFSDQRPLLRASIVFAIGLIPQALILVVVGRSFNSGSDRFSFSAGENVTLQLTLFIFYGLIIATLVAASRRKVSAARRSIAVVTLMLAAIALVAFAYAYKAALVFALAIVVLGIHYRYRPLNPKVVAVAVGVLAFVLFPIINTERALINEGKLTSGGILGRIEAGTVGSVVRLASSGPQGYLDASIGSLLARSNGVDSLALIEKYTPKVRPYQYGLTYVALPAEAYAPRAIWAGKPKPLSADFGYYYGGRAGSQTNFSITNLGDLYMNFGVLGVLVGAGVLGILTRFVYDLLVIRTRASDTGLLLYLSFFVFIVSGVEQELMPILSQLLKALPILLVLGFALSHTFRRRALARSAVAAGQVGGTGGA